MGYVHSEEEYRGYRIVIENDDNSYHLNPRTNHDNAATLVTWEREYGSPDGDSRGKPEFATHDFDPEYMHLKYDDGIVAGHTFSPTERRSYTYTPSEDNLDDGSFEAYRWRRRRERKSKDDGLIIVALDRTYDGGFRTFAYTDDCANAVTNRNYSSTKPHAVRIDGVAYMTYETARKEFGEGRAKRLTKRAREHALRCIEAEVEEYSDWATGNVWDCLIYDRHGELVESCGGYIGDPDEDDWIIAEARATVDALCREAEREAERLAELAGADPALLALTGAHGMLRGDEPI